jgi:hypothetical protein
VRRSFGLNVINRYRIDWPSHPLRRFENGGDRRGILGECVPKLKELALFRDPNPSRAAHGIFQFRLPLNQAKSFV